MKLRERLELMALLLAIFNDYFDLVEKLLNLFGCYSGCRGSFVSGYRRQPMFQRAQATALYGRRKAHTSRYYVRCGIDMIDLSFHTSS